MMINNKKQLLKNKILDLKTDLNNNINNNKNIIRKKYIDLNKSIRITYKKDKTTLKNKLNELNDNKKNDINKINNKLINERKEINKILINNKNSKTNDNINKLNNQFNIILFNKLKNMNNNSNKFIKNIEENLVINEINKIRRNEPIKVNGKHVNNSTNFNNIKSLSNRDKIKLILNNINQNDKYLITIGNINYTLSKKNKNSVDDIIEDRPIYNSNGSDKELKEILTNDNQEMTLEYIDATNANYGASKLYNKNSGEYFNMYLKDEYNYDLTKYQVYHQNDIDQNLNNCFINCLILSNQLSDKQIKSIKIDIKCRDIPLKTINTIAKKYNLNIIIKKHNDKNLTKYLYNNDKKINIINIGLINNHYFIIEQVPYTTYYIKNYMELKDIEDNNKIYEKNGKYYKKDDKHFITSYDIIKFLYENKETYLNNIDLNNQSDNHQYLNKIDDNIMNIENLNYDESNVKYIINEDDKEIKPVKKYFCDFETREYNINNTLKHIAYLCCLVDENDNKQRFYGTDSGLKLLQSLKSDVLLIFHNAKYDFNFLIKYMRTKNIIQKGNKLISYSGYFGKFNITIKDSLLIINMPLHKFGKNFNLEQPKEIMPYGLYNNEELFNKKYLTVDEIKPYLNNNNDYNQFIYNCKKWNLFNSDNKINIIEYSAIYCEIDCQVLKNGYNVMNKWSLHGTEIGDKKIEGINIDINNKLTLASMGYEYILNNKCLEKCTKLSNIPSIFISKSIRGGRVMSNQNKIIKCDKILNDFDAVSLYPSAMVRLCNELGGILQGAPKILQTTDYNIIKNYDGYFVKIRITKINKILDFPLLSIEDKITKTKNYTNNIVNHEFIVDKITLEDLIKFQEVEFEIINGYYFNEGRNNKLGDIIKNLFNTRLALKADDENEAQLLYKEIMNSIYGKTILKPIDTEIKIISKKKLNNFLIRNYNWIKQYELIDDSDDVKITMYKSINSHYNSPQIGSEILSMSKRIMNEVMTLAQDNNIKLYYQDTDSMHIEDDKVKLLSDLYKEKYNKELIGKNMGEFHCDFKLEYNNTKYNEKTYIDNIVSIKSIFLGKKCYIDKLQGNIYNDKNEIIDKVYGFHCRMKGISSKAIDHYTKTKNINEMTIYELLANNNELEFDLAGNGTITKFKQNKNFSIETIKEFKRNIKFTCKYNQNDFIKY